MIGTILGGAFDRAIGVMLRNWRVVVVVWVIMGAAYVFDRTPSQSIIGLLSVGLVPIPGILAARSQSSGYSFRASALLRFFLVSAVWTLAAIGSPAIILGIFIPNFLHDRAAGDTSIGPLGAIVLTAAGALALLLWISTKWSLAWVIAFYRSRPVVASLRESWAFTTGMFWQTLLLNISVSVA